MESTKGRDLLNDPDKTTELRLGQECSEENADDDDGHFSSGRLGGGQDPMFNLFRVPPTDVSISSYRMVPINPFMTASTWSISRSILKKITSISLAVTSS